ncbi:hypothetical protein E4U22_007442, partial [Claviceps purpurea]
PVTIGTVRGFQCFPPSPQNRVLAQPTPLHRPTSQLPPLAITTTPSLPSLPVQSLPSLLSLPLLPSLSSLSPRPSLPPRHCCPCASAISILDSVVATASPPPPLLDLNLRRLHAQPSLVDDFSQGRILKPELDIASLLTPVWQPTKGAPPSTYDCRRGPSTPNSCDRRAVTPPSQYCLFCDASSRPSRVSSY